MWNGSCESFYIIKNITESISIYCFCQPIIFFFFLFAFKSKEHYKDSILLLLLLLCVKTLFLFLIKLKIILQWFFYAFKRFQLILMYMRGKDIFISFNNVNKSLAAWINLKCIILSQTNFVKEEKSSIKLLNSIEL